MMKDRRINKITGGDLNIIEAIVSISVNAGGTGVFMSDISNVLPCEGAQYHLLTCSSSSVADLPVDDRVNLVKLPVAEAFQSGLFNKSCVTSSMSELNDAKNVDLIHLHGIWLQFCRRVSQWALRTEKPLVVSPHGMLEPWA